MPTHKTLVTARTVRVLCGYAPNALVKENLTYSKGTRDTKVIACKVRTAFHGLMDHRWTHGSVDHRLDSWFHPEICLVFLRQSSASHHIEDEKAYEANVEIKHMHLSRHKSPQHHNIIKQLQMTRNPPNNEDRMDCATN